MDRNKALKLLQEELETLDENTLERKKLIEEISKLQLEQKDLCRPAYLRPAVILGAITSLAAAYSFFWQYQASSIREQQAKLTLDQSRRDLALVKKERAQYDAEISARQEQLSAIAAAVDEAVGELARLDETADIETLREAIKNARNNLDAASRLTGNSWSRIVADIAWRRLSEDARHTVRILLSEDPEHPTLADAAIWADRLRARREWRWSRRIHYVNIPRDKSYVKSRDCPELQNCPDDMSCPERACVVEAIEYYRELLAVRDDLGERLVALKFLTALIGDIHRPLHVAYADDQGGNSISVKFFGASTNLHHMWDSALVRKTHKSWLQYATELNSAITQTDISDWGELSAEAWANESHLLAAKVYEGIPDNKEFGQAYFDAWLPIAEQQMQKAGVRLAAVLNHACAAY